MMGQPGCPGTEQHWSSEALGLVMKCFCFQVRPTAADRELGLQPLGPLTAGTGRHLVPTAVCRYKAFFTQSAGSVFVSVRVWFCDASE